MTDERFERLQGIQQHIEDANYNDFGQSTNLIYEEMVTLNAWKSFSGKTMSEYKRDLNEQKVSAYTSLIASQRAVKLDIPPSIAKDYIASKCGELQYKFDFAERVNSNLAYYIDTLRSILSSLKQELATLQYQGTQNINS